MKRLLKALVALAVCFVGWVATCGIMLIVLGPRLAATNLWAALPTILWIVLFIWSLKMWPFDKPKKPAPVLIAEPTPPASPYMTVAEAMAWVQSYLKTPAGMAHAAEINTPAALLEQAKDFANLHNATEVLCGRIPWPEPPSLGGFDGTESLTLEQAKRVTDAWLATPAGQTWWYLKQRGYTPPEPDAEPSLPPSPGRLVLPPPQTPPVRDAVPVQRKRGSAKVLRFILSIPFWLLCVYLGLLGLMYLVFLGLAFLIPTKANLGDIPFYFGRMLLYSILGSLAGFLAGRIKGRG